MNSHVDKTRVKTRKPHRCFGCNRKIKVGSFVECLKEAVDGSIQSSYWCDRCLELHAKEDPYGDGIFQGDYAESYTKEELALVIDQGNGVEPADDPRHPGNHSRYKRYGKKCATEGCEGIPGTQWSPHWCQPCNGERLRRITGQLEAIVESHAQKVEHAKAQG